jgi:DNA-binding PadR family transcriptional regulator
MLDLAILGLLEEQPLHGYEIRRQVREHLGVLANVSFGSLYPALARLEAAGAVEATQTPEPPDATPGPPTGSLSGEWAVFRARRHSGGHARRSRKVYRITPQGHQLFAQLLTEHSGSDDARNFGLRWAFARHLAPQARVGLLERRRAQLVQRLDELASTSSDTELDVYARSVVDHTADGVRQDVAWLDRLLESEHSAQATSQTRKTPARRTAAARSSMSTLDRTEPIGSKRSTQ